MQAHILAHFISESASLSSENGTEGESKHEKKQPDFPFLCLTVSGGHTQIVKVNSHLEFELLGETLDDAVGEAFDKAAKIMGLPYPGGPLIDKYAMDGDPKRFSFSRSHVPGLNYSFSGIKTSFLYFIRDQVNADPDFVSKNLKDICASYQHHLISVLLHNVLEASKQYNIKEIAIAGGVSANSELRRQITEMGKKHQLNIYIPKFEYCTDNAAMIAITGHFKFLKNQFADLSVTPLARYDI